MRPRRFRLTQLEDRLAPAVATWDGGGADSNWMTAANWAGDVAPNPGDGLLFPAGAARVANVNDFAANTAFGQIHISGIGYTLSGNAVSLGGGILVDATSNTTPPTITTFSLPVTLTSDQAFNVIFNNPITLTAAININGFSLTIQAESGSSIVISGAISGSGQLFGITTGLPAGVLALTAINTFTGTTTIPDGSLEVSGVLPGPVTLGSGSHLTGSGRVGPLTSNGGIVEPGLRSTDGTSVLQPGTLTTGDLSLQNDFSDLNLSVTAQGKSGLNVQGTAHLGGSLFIAYQVGQHPVHVGGVFTIIQNDGTDPVVGTFLNEPEGSIIQQGAIPLRISYHGGDGNDVTLTAISQSSYAVAAGAGGGPIVNVYNADGGLVRSFLAYDAAFRGGVHVTVVDVTGDLVPDVITAPGPGGGPVVRIWDGATGAMVRQFAAYDPNFRGGVWLATARLVNNAPIDIVTGAGPGGGPHVRAFNATTGAVVGEFMAFDPNFRGGITVAATDGRPIHFGFVPGQIIVGAGTGGVPVVRVFTGPSGPMTSQFLAYDSAFRGGVNVAVGSFIGGNDIVTAPMSGGGPHVRVFAGQPNGSIQVGQLEKEFLAYAGSFTGGVTIATHLLDPFFPPTLITGPGPGGGPHVEEWSFANNSFTVTKNLIAFDPTFTGGVFVG